MKVLLFESSMAGHRAVYASQIVRECSTLPIEFILAMTDKAADSEEYKLTVAPLAKHFELDSNYRWRAASVKHVPKQAVGHLREALERHKPDHVYLPWGDGVGHFLGLRHLTGRRTWPGDVEVEAICHRCRLAYPTRGLAAKVKNFAQRQSLTAANFTRYHFVDVIEYELWRRWLGGEQVRMLPDPVDGDQGISKSAAREQLGIPGDRRYVSTVGAVNVKKGCLAAIEALGRGDVDDDVCLLFVGRQDDAVRQALAGDYRWLLEQSRVFSIDRYVTLDELNLGLAAADLIYIGYEDHVGISSIVLRAAAAGRPVLVAPFYWAQRIVPQFDLGTIASTRQPEAFASALRNAIDDAQSWQPSASGTQLVRFHATNNFGANLTRRLRERLGLDPAEGLIEWDDVDARSRS
ncbi:MAG: glycosyltransferase [Planctomycetota bacterium]